MIKKKLSQWFGSRMPIGDVVTLKQKSTYILPTKAGFLMLGVIVLMMIAATNYQNNLAFLLTFLILSIALVSIIFTFKNLQGLVFKLVYAPSVFVGETLQIHIKLSSQSRQNHFTIATGFSKSSLYLTNVLEDTDNQVVIETKAKQRGWFYLSRIMATSRFPFGLLRVWTWFRFKSPVLIYPKPIKPPLKGEQGTSEEQQGSVKTFGNSDLYGLKIYQAGDMASRIDWKAFARERGLFSKEFVAYQQQNLVFDWNDFPATDGELRLSYLCYLVLEADRCRYDYSLRLPTENIALNSGESHRIKCLQALALYGNQG